jgi:hypothetical protein
MRLKSLGAVHQPNALALHSFGAPCVVALVARWGETRRRLRFAVCE